MNKTVKNKKSNRLSIREIAKIAGVSPTTVSFVLNNRGGEFGISESTCERIREVVRQHNYRQNIHGRAIMARKTFLIGVIIHHFVSSFWNQIIAGISSELTANGYHMLIAEAGNDLQKEQEAFEYMSSIGVDGIITALNFSPFNTDDITLPAYWHEQHVVNILHPLPEIPSVFTDHRLGTEMIAQELWNKGHRKVAFLGRDTRDLSIRLNENLRIFKDFYEERNCTVELFETPGDFLARRGDCTAVFCRRDSDAAQLYAAAYTAGLKIPEAFSVAGYGGDCNDWLLVHPKLTTIREAKEELGVMAAKKLLAEINEKNSPDAPLHEALPPQFIAGASIKNLA